MTTPDSSNGRETRGYWVGSLARILGAGSGIPFVGGIVQWNAEVDARHVQDRLRRLEDPISNLHLDVRDISKLLYSRTPDIDDGSVPLSDEEKGRYSRVLAILEANGRIGGTHTFTARFASGVWLNDPEYVLYMAALYEDPDLMERLLQRVDSARPRTRLDGRELAHEYAVPLATVRAMLQTFEHRGLGIMSKTLGAVEYYPTA